MSQLIPIKSPNDPKEYIALVLENGLKILLVSDMDCDKAAVSVSIGAGSMNDPEDIPGLAHLCEHLLSIENNNPPGYKSFNIFVSENGGMFNAFTARDQTNFHFDVNTAVFAEALQRFSKFFTSASKLSEKDVEKEITIVHSEFMSKVNKDSWRKMGVDAATSEENHPFHKFTTGNETSLLEIPKRKNINVLNAATAFRSTYYVASIMTVVVYGKETVKNLEKICVPFFSKIPTNENTQLPHWEESPYGKDYLQRRIHMQSVSDLRDFYIVFPIPNTRPHYKTFPHGYITRLLGNRGPGSLYTFLYNNQWIEYSYMNSSIPARGFGELSIGFQLTKQGLAHTEEIILNTFQYIKMLKEKGPQQYFWKEMQEILSLQFIFLEKEVPVEFVQRTSNLMHVYPLRDILSIGSIISEYDPSLLEKFMNYLSPGNCRILTVSKENSVNCHQEYNHDQWYGAKYTSRKFTEEEIKLWNFCETVEHFYLPKENNFITKNFHLKSLKTNNKISTNDPIAFSSEPTLILDTPIGKAWFLQDDEFKMAKGAIRLEISSPLSLVDPVSYNLNQLWFLTLKNIIDEEFYQATLAGLYHDINPSLYGTEITVSGYSDKLLLLMEAVFLNVVRSVDIFNIMRNHFPTVKDRYASGLANLKNVPVRNVTTYYLSLLLREKRFSNEELLDALNDCTEENLKTYIQLFFFRTRFEWFIYGNFIQQEAESLVHSCIGLLHKLWSTRPLISSQIPRLREICISPGPNFVFADALLKSGSATAMLIQIGILTIKDSVILDIIDQIVHEPLFTQLRNREQIGYIIRSSIRRSNESQSLLIYVQGDKTPAFISDRIDFALLKIEESLKKMCKAEFNQHKTSVRLRKLEKPKTMLMLLNKLWNNEIYSRRYDFKRFQKEIDVLEKISHEEVISFFQEYLSPVAKRKVLEIHFAKKLNDSQSQANEKGASTANPCTLSSSDDRADRGLVLNDKIFINDVTKWKMTMQLYPHTLPST